MLSTLYTLFHNRIASMLRYHGIDPRIGYYHERRAGHYALASDLMEPFRHFMEQLMIRMISHKTVTPKDFPEGLDPTEDACHLPSPVMRKLILAFEARLQKRYTTRDRKSVTLATAIELDIKDYHAAVVLNQRRYPVRIS